MQVDLFSGMQATYLLPWLSSCVCAKWHHACAKAGSCSVCGASTARGSIDTFHVAPPPPHPHPACPTHRLTAATRGHALLKKKADALNMRFRQLLKEIIDAKENLGNTMKGSFFAYTEAQYAAGDSIKHTIVDNVDTATVKVRGAARCAAHWSASPHHAPDDDGADTPLWLRLCRCAVQLTTLPA